MISTMLTTFCLAFLAVVSAGHLNLGHKGYEIEHSRYGEHGIKHEIDFYAHPKYEYKYDVKDHHTGDVKSQEEHRDGDRVHGHYSVVESDGSIRVVNYHADKHIGFNAEVKRIGPNVHHYIQPHHHQASHTADSIYDGYNHENEVYGRGGHVY